MLTFVKIRELYLSGVGIEELVAQYTKERIESHNLNNVMLEHARKLLDYKLIPISCNLDIAYYCFWKFGDRFNFYGYDACLSLAESKKQFDYLQALLYTQYEIRIHEANIKLDESKKYPEEFYNTLSIEDGKVTTKYEIDIEKVQEIKALGYSFNVDI